MIIEKHELDEEERQRRFIDQQVAVAKERGQEVKYTLDKKFTHMHIQML